MVGWLLIDIPGDFDAVEAFAPYLTYPVIILPTMNWGKPKDEHCSAALMIIMLDPRKIVLRRPSMSPIQMVVMAPKKHPTL